MISSSPLARAVCRATPRLALAALLCASLPCPLRAQLPFPGVVPGTEIGDGLPPGYEPSGAAWHLRLNRLLLVDDEGNLSSLDADGGSLQTWFIGGDLEAVCVADPDTPFVYIGLEHPDSVLEFDLDSGAVTRQFLLDGTLTGPVNLGLEALTFARNPAHPEGGIFYAGLQDDGRVYVFELSVASSATLTTATLLATLAPAPLYNDISGLDWVAATDTLYAVYDSHNEVIAFDRAGVVSRSWVLPGHDQEGIAIRGCRLFVAQDTGEVKLYEQFPSAAVCDTASVDVATLSLAAGGVQTIDLEFGPALGGGTYILLGTSTDTLPGFWVDAVNIPLTIDPYFTFLLTNPNTPPLGASLGALNAAGEAAATFTVPAGANPALAGLKLYHSAVLLGGGVVTASNPVPLSLLP